MRRDQGLRSLPGCLRRVRQDTREPGGGAGTGSAQRPTAQAASGCHSKNNALRLLLARHYAAEGHWLEAEKAYAAMAEESPTPEIYRGLFAVWNSRPGERGTDYVLGKLNEVIARSVAKKGGHQA